MGERREGKGSRDVVLLRSGLMTECDCLYHVDLKLTCKYDFSSFRSNQRVVCGGWGGGRGREGGRKRASVVWGRLASDTGDVDPQSVVAQWTASRAVDSLFLII